MTCSINYARHTIEIVSSENQKFKFDIKFNVIVIMACNMPHVPTNSAVHFGQSNGRMFCCSSQIYIHSRLEDFKVLNEFFIPVELKLSSNVRSNLNG